MCASKDDIFFKKALFCGKDRFRETLVLYFNARMFYKAYGLGSKQKIQHIPFLVESVWSRALTQNLACPFPAWMLPDLLSHSSLLKILPSAAPCISKQIIYSATVYIASLLPWTFNQYLFLAMQYKMITALSRAANQNTCQLFIGC